jgi:aspartate kinase
MMLTSGEQVSAALLAAALQARGIPATGVPAARLGLIADGPADRAKLVSIQEGMLAEELARAVVVVLPGGQALDKQGRVVMLGRNSSDLSAVAAAIAVGAGQCEFYSDVPGICSADPYLVPAARTLPLVSYATMQMLADAGAKVVQGQAVRWARNHDIQIRCCSLPPTAACETVIADAPPVAMAVLHQRGEVWSFDTIAKCFQAQSRLTVEGLDAVGIRQDGRLMLVVTGHGRHDIVAHCCEEGTLHKALCLLTVLRATGQVDRLVVPRDGSIAELRRRHELLYPRSAPHQVRAPVKLRSTRSDILIANRRE